MEFWAQRNANGVGRFELEVGMIAKSGMGREISVLRTRSKRSATPSLSKVHISSFPGIVATLSSLLPM